MRIDGVSRARAPLLLDLPEGRYQMRVERAGFRVEERTVLSGAGKKRLVKIDLSPKVDPVRGSRLTRLVSVELPWQSRPGEPRARRGRLAALPAVRSSLPTVQATSPRPEVRCGRLCACRSTSSRSCCCRVVSIK